MFTRRRLLVTSAAASIAAPTLWCDPSIAALSLTQRRSNCVTKRRLRRNASQMAPNDPFFSDYANAIDAMHKLGADDLRSWRNQALVHISRCTHGVTDFLHWHRHYIYYFESICAKLIGKPNFSLAYWDWREVSGWLPSPFFDIDKLNVTYWNDVSNAQSDHWSQREVRTVGVRGLARDDSIPDAYRGRFAPEFLAILLLQSDFNIFKTMLEVNFHNLVHNIVGYSPDALGHMLDGMSALDPIFWLHHCNVDRLWAQWQAAGNATPELAFSYANHFVDANGDLQSSPTSANSLDIASFGYSYEAPKPPVDPGGPPPLSDPNPALGALPLTAPTTILTIRTNVRARVKSGAVVRLAIPDLSKLLSERRIFQDLQGSCPPRKASEFRRLLAKLEVAPPLDRRVSLAVFVNCPNLSPKTPIADPHCAGVVSFFGPNDHGPPTKTVYVDLSGPLRRLAAEGRLDPQEIWLQFMPLSLSDTVALSEWVGVGAVTILST